MSRIDKIRPDLKGCNVKPPPFKRRYQTESYGRLAAAALCCCYNKPFDDNLPYSKDRPLSL